MNSGQTNIYQNYRRLTIFISIFMLITQSFAVSVYKIDIGDIYYVNGGILGEDRRVIVQRVDTSDSTVKVRTTNGDSEWVKASKLLTKQGNANRNTGNNIGGAALGMWALFCIGEMSKDKKYRSKACQ